MNCGGGGTGHLHPEYHHKDTDKFRDYQTKWQQLSVTNRITFTATASSKDTDKFFNNLMKWPMNYCGGFF
jgi:hypothetical protein